MRVSERELAIVLAALDGWTCELECWPTELLDEDRCIKDNSYLSKFSPVSVHEVRELLERLSGQDDRNRFSVDTFDDEAEMAGPPTHPIEIRQLTSAIRVILGVGVDAPDLYVERTSRSWRIFIHPDRGDPACCVSITPRSPIVSVEDTISGRSIRFSGDHDCK